MHVIKTILLYMHILKIFILQPQKHQNKTLAISNRIQNNYEFNELQI